ncbi:type II toxin-antitoxin system CcdA family antitoxin [Thermopolyspora sp. NPDC052614]|uniref:type II toxin-antitoxin system CcdA family antitoxin n=1 Tax=Thermopolyspora sp. NPDC052614 TaxID=3155682 RepID=UPI003424907F
MVAKDTITVTVDHDLIEHAKAQVGEGKGRSLSDYVNEAIRERVARERRRRALWNARADKADEARVDRLLAHIESQDGQ